MNNSGKLPLNQGQVIDPEQPALAAERIYHE